MTLRTPYEFDLDPITNPLGEKLLSVADPIGSALGARTYYLARRFTFDGGDYTFTVTADDAATIWLGTSQLNSRMILSATLAIPGQVTINIPAGQYRLDVFLQNLPVEPTPCVFTLVIKRGTEVIYTSAKEGWLLDDAQISDDDLPPPSDYRFSLPVFTTMPNWQGGILERLSWLTDVLSSETDAEQRRSVRRSPRRSFEAQFLRGNMYDASGRDRLDTFFAGVGPGLFLVPIWHEQVKMHEGIDMEASGVVFADGEFKMREYRQGDLVLVNNGNPDDYDLLQVGDVEENRFSWAFPPPRRWPNGTRIYPLRVARFGTQAPRMLNITDRISRAAALFELVEPYTVEPSFGGSVGGEPLFRFAIDRATTLDATYDRKTYTMDNEAGIPVITDTGRDTAITLQVKLRVFGRGNSFALRQFLAAARGRSKKFQCPTFMQDVMLDGDVAVGTTELKIRPQGFTAFMATPQSTRTMLAFSFDNGSQTLYRIVKSAYEVYKRNPNGQIAFPKQVVGEVLVMDSALPEIESLDLKRISFVAETRLDQDVVEIQHNTNQQRVTDVTLMLRQIANKRKRV